VAMGGGESGLTNAIPTAVLAVPRVSSTWIAMPTARQVARMSDECTAYILILGGLDAERAKLANT